MTSSFYVTEGTERVLIEVADARSYLGAVDREDGTHTDLAGVSALIRISTGTRWATGTATWREVFTEEAYSALGEVHPESLRSSLVDVAALVVAWIEALDRRDPDRDPHRDPTG